MTPEEKIAKVLKRIKSESSINPNPKLVKFNLNYNVVGGGVLSEDEERRILFKLENEGAIELSLSESEVDLYKPGEIENEVEEPREVTVISSDEAENLLNSPYYWIKILPGLEDKYKTYVKYLNPKELRTKNENKNKVNDHKNISSNTKQSFTIGGDYVIGDKVGHDKNISQESKDPNLLTRYWWTLIIPIVAIVIGFIITQGKLPGILQKSTAILNSDIPRSEEATILDRSVFQLVAETDYGGPILNIQKRWQEFTGLKTKDEHATIMNYGEASLGKTWVDFRGVDSYGAGFNVVTCVFNSEWRQKIGLLGSSDKEVIFKGTISGDLTGGYVPILEDCSVKEPSTSNIE